MIVLLLKLLIAHIIGDFLLQPKKWVDNKNLKKHRSKFLYYHLLIHVLLLLLVLEFNFSFWLGIVVIVVSHFLIDLAKLHLSVKANPVILFVGDQLAHILILVGVVFYYKSVSLNYSDLFSLKSLTLLLALLSVTTVSAITMQVIMGQWELKEDNAENSLPKAGFYIGILERLFVFGFVVLNQWQAIGLLIAAKSVFRFGDLSKARDRKLTEYILIGTLLSFGLAVTIGLIYQKLQTI